MASRQSLQSALFNRQSAIKALVALVAISAVLFVLTPPAPRRVETTGWDDLARRTVAGAYHVHTTRSDGHGDKATVAAAAARAGLKFVILTDHGDATRPPDPPEYLDGVLMLDAVEISTDDGHYVALDMPRAPYPLGGTGAAVVEDVHRLGGFGIAAHPDSPKPALRWMDTTSPIDGIEWINADSEWRDETRPQLVRAGLGYFLRPAGALASMLDRPATLDRWDQLLRTRRVVALAASDAHGGPGQRVEDQSRTFFSTMGIPSYEASFRELSIRAVLEHPLSASASEDARAVYGAIRKGSVFSVIDALASPALLDFRATGSSAVTLDANATLPSDGELVLIGPGGASSGSTGPLRSELYAGSSETYRVEVRLPGTRGQPLVPWLVSNAIQVGPAAEAGRTEHPAASVELTAPGTIPPFPWRIEKDPASSAILRNTDRTAELAYTLAAGQRNNQFVALATDVSGQAFSSLRFVLAADRPARISVQARVLDGRRWARSFYVDASASAIEAPLASFRRVGPGPEPTPPSTELSSILLVVDLTNAAPSRSGTLSVLASELVK
jgi:hypothetical protein